MFKPIYYVSLYILYVKDLFQVYQNIYSSSYIVVIKMKQDSLISGLIMQMLTCCYTVMNWASSNTVQIVAEWQRLICIGYMGMQEV